MKSYDKLLEENRAMKLQLSVISDDSKRVVEQQKKIEKLKAQNAGLTKALHSMKQDNETVFIPKFVAEFIEEAKVEKELKIFGAFYGISQQTFDYELFDWVFNGNNQELFARAWLDGYVVEKQKLYYIKLVDDFQSYLHVKSNGELFIDVKTPDSLRKIKFTYDEVLELGEKYIPFAVDVEKDDLETADEI